MLRKKAQTIHHFNRATEQLVADLWRGLQRFQGVGLAAPQLGLPLRAFVVEYEGARLTCINPVVVPQPGLGPLPTSADEACLSLPGVYARGVERPPLVTLRYRTLEGRERSLTAEGWLARVIQHELDHLDGVLICDHVAAGNLIPLRFPQPGDHQR